MIPLFKVFMDGAVDTALSKVLHSGYIGQGEKVRQFEAALGKRFGNCNVLALSAGTHGLHLALRLAGVGKGDEVVTTPLTCTATNWPILMQGATPIWADVKDDFNVDPESVRTAITDRTKAIICVHWGGYPCDMAELTKIAYDNNLVLIEDAAHAYGSDYKGIPIGSMPGTDYTMMSFQAIKHLTTVDGGALFCKTKEQYDKAKLLRWYGIDREGPRTDFRCEQPIADWGYKYHMNDVCATIGLQNMAAADRNIERCRANAALYDRELAGVPGLKITQTADDRKSSYWLYTIMVENRSEFCYMMGSRGIAVSRVHERNDKHPCTSDFCCFLPKLEEVVSKQICIPVGWWLGDDQVEHIIESIKGGW
jgi:dTDP-4-amino-4,6-dideoxygalactose transaminase